MIRADKGGPLGALWSGYVGWKVRRSFRAVWLRGELPSAERGLLVYANHPGFWDGFAMHVLACRHGLDAYCAMDEANLRRYRFLRRLGAFSVRPGDGASSLESLRYARALLERPKSMLVIFPEGELRPMPDGPPRLERGVELLSRWAEASVPVALRYAFFEHELPDLLLEAGPPHAAAELPVFERSLGACVERVRAVRSLDGFTRLCSGRRGMAELWAGEGDG